MFAKTNCLNCGNGIEFDPDQLGNEKFLVVNCPHCGKETVLTLQKAEPPQVVYVQSPQQQSQKKSHGVFYYVFWGVVSLFATLFVLWILLAVFVGVGFVAIPAFMAARHEAQIQNGITNTVDTATAAANDLLIQKTNYINNSLTLYDFKSGYEDTALDGRVPCVGFKIKNNGDKTLKEIDVTVYFKDSNQNVIYDDKFCPVLVTEFGTDNEPLKPGYIWQNANNVGYCYEVKKVPSEWQEGNAEAKITDIKFSDPEK